MTTVATIVQDAMFAAQVLGQDQAATSGDQALVLRRLVRMLDSLSTEKLMIYANDAEQFTMTAGQQSYSTALLTSGRPVSITSMRVRLNNLDYEVEPMDQNQFNQITYKSTTAIPRQFYYDGAYPQATMFFYPVPYAAFTCILYCQRRIQGYSTLTLATDLVLPEGYEAMIIASLAVDISPSFGKKASDDLIRDMVAKKGALKRLNYSPLEMNTPFDQGYDISNGFPYRGF